MMKSFLSFMLLLACACLPLWAKDDAATTVKLPVTDGLLLWLHADDASVQRNDKGNIIGWKDLSPNGYTLTLQQKDANPYSMGIVGKRPGVETAGYHANLSMTLPEEITGPFTVFVAWSTPGQYDLAGQTKYRRLISMSNTAANGEDWKTGVSITNNTGVGEAVTARISACNASEKRRVKYISLGGNIGTNGVFSEPFGFRGAIGEVIIYRRTLTTEENTTIKNYLMENFGTHDLVETQI